MTDPFPDSRPLAEAFPDEPEWPAVPAGVAWREMPGSAVSITWYAKFGAVSLKKACRVYWGSHGCDLTRGHRGDCDCGCCECESHPDPDSGCVGKAPYYGPDTWFYGEDVTARGLPLTCPDLP